MHALDRQSKGCTDRLQTVTLGIALTDEVIALGFGDMFFGDRVLRERDAPIEADKQPVDGEIQGG
jgi:hypothetical protein